MARPSRQALLAALLLILLALPVIAVVRNRRGGEGSRAAAACRNRTEAEAAREERERGERGEAEKRGEEGEGRSDNGLYAGPRGAEPPCGEVAGLPESFADLAKANSSIASRSVAPGTQVKTGAYRAAVNEARALDSTDGTWQPYGRSPLETGREEYDTSRGSTREGLGNVAGRMTSFARDPSSGRMFAAGSNAGVWTSTDNGDRWSSVGDGLPTQVVSGVAWSSANGGTLLVLTGDNAFGGSTFSGMGAYRSRDLGKTWEHAGGIPDGVLGFKLVVDPTDPAKVYAGTGAGLFRSTDAGATYANVDLPTGEDAGSYGTNTPNCTGKAPTVKDCFLANMVTDVVVQGPANAQSAGGKPGAVLAAVGWRGGSSALNKDGTSQAPGNGIYRSDTGAPGTFTNVRIESNNVPQAGGDAITKPVLGRIALGIANGGAQNHQVVYALVQDAVKFNGGAGGLDASEQGIPNPTYLNGIWVSTDFGSTWKQLDGSNRINSDPTSNSTLSPPVCGAPVISYCPGVQAWYNLWIEPDPTRATASGTPTRYAFGLEEVWTNDPNATPPTGLDGSTPTRSIVVGRYFANESCTLLNATNGLPVCPTAQNLQTPKTTTHPDQHGAMWVPDPSGDGVTLFAANDGGVYRQHRASNEELDNNAWGTGANTGLNTLQPYDIAIAKDGTAYMGLQDNGEAKIDPDGRTYMIYGGDGFFSAVDPDKSGVAYEEYTGGDISVTKDGGKTWTDIQPSGLTSAQFSTPFEMDANDANHLVIGGRDIEETTAGPTTTSSTWSKVFDLGTRTKPGDANASASGDSPDNKLSAVDVKTIKAATGAPTGPKTADVAYTAGDDTIPGGQSDPTGLLPRGTFAPGTYTDRVVRVGANDGDATMTTTISWGDSGDDWDLYVYRRESDGSLTEIGNSAEGDTTSEQVLASNPSPGDYIVRVVNFAATGTFDAKVAFTQRTPANTSVSAVYAAFCGYCDTITEGTPFGNGLATNVGGSKPAKAGTPDGWHIAKAAGLPVRYITSVRMDPDDPSTVYVTLAGYGRRWAAPGAVGDDTSKIGAGHVFKSTDAGASFKDISGNLPDVPANWSVLRNGRVIVGTDLGVFISNNTDGGAYVRLGNGLPNVPVSTLRFKPGDPDLLFVATFGRGAYTYRFTPQAAAPSSSATPCNLGRGLKSVKVRNLKSGVRFAIKRAVKRKFTLDVFRESRGRRVLREQRVAHFPGRSKSFTWKKGRRAKNGYYFVRILMKGTDAKRLTLVRKRGKFRTRPGFFVRRTCKLIRMARLTRPVFGGRTRVPLASAIQLTNKGSVRVVVRRGNKTVRRKTIKIPRAGAIRRYVVKAAKLKRGEYRVTMTATAGTRREVVRLTARRL